MMRDSQSLLPSPAARFALISALACAAALLLSLVGAVPARAQGNNTYEALAQRSDEVRTPLDLAAILWSQVATCEGADTDIIRRRCLGLRAARRARLAGRTFRMAGDRLAFSSGDYDNRKQALGFKVYSCLACAAPVAVEALLLRVVGPGPVTVFGTSLLGPVLVSAGKSFADEAQAMQWKKDVVPRLRVEMVFRVGRPEPMWSRGGIQGFAVEIAGYRVHDPCTGAVIAAKPEARDLERDSTTCTGADLLALQQAQDAARQAQKAAAAAAKAAELPEVFTPVDIQNALQPATEVAQECYGIYGVAGEAKFRITINHEGRVASIEQEGYFLDTPTGDCIAQAIKQATFPKTRKKSTTVNYPFVLR